MLKKFQSRKGFTLVEMLIVVAIIAVLACVAIPIYNAQLEKSRERVDLANARTATSLANADYLLNEYTGAVTYYFEEGSDQELVIAEKVSTVTPQPAGTIAAKTVADTATIQPTSTAAGTYAAPVAPLTVVINYGLADVDAQIVNSWMTALTTPQ